MKHISEILKDVLAQIEDELGEPLPKPDEAPPKHPTLEE